MMFQNLIYILYERFNFETETCKINASENFMSWLGFKPAAATMLQTIERKNQFPDVDVRGCMYSCKGKCLF
jgi:hypothetical protein